MKSIILPDIIATGIYNAQIAYKNKALTPNRKTTMFEIELPIGRGGASTINDKAHQISEDLVICAKPGELRHTKLPFKCYYVHLIVNEGQLYDMLSSLPDFIELEDTKEIRDIFVSICERGNTHTTEEEVLIQSLILKLIYTLHRSVAATKNDYRPKPNNRLVIEQTVAYIKDHISEELSLTALSGIISFSPIYFHKLFKTATGKTLHEYIEEQRIKRAIELLISTGKTLTEIAYECGFSSQSYFSYAFKRRMNCTPREYVKKVQEGYEREQ